MTLHITPLTEILNLFTNGRQKIQIFDWKNQENIYSGELWNFVNFETFDTTKYGVISISSFLEPTDTIRFNVIKLA